MLFEQRNDWAILEAWRWMWSTGKTMACVMSRCNNQVSSSALVNGRWLLQNLAIALDKALNMWAHNSRRILLI